MACLRTRRIRTTASHQLVKKRNNVSLSLLINALHKWRKKLITSHVSLRSTTFDVKSEMKKNYFYRHNSKSLSLW